MYALTDTLAALLERQRNGMGPLIDISMLECLAEWMSAPAYYERYRGLPHARAGLRPSTLVPHGAFRIEDGSLLNFSVQNDGQWKRLCEAVLGRQALEPLIAQIRSGMEQGELEYRPNAADVPSGAINDLTGLLGHRQLHERGRWGTISTATGNPAVGASDQHCQASALTAERSTSRRAYRRGSGGSIKCRIAPNERGAGSGR